MRIDSSLMQACFFPAPRFSSYVTFNIKEKISQIVFIGPIFNYVHTDNDNNIILLIWDTLHASTKTTY